MGEERRNLVRGQASAAVKPPSLFPPAPRPPPPSLQSPQTSTMPDVAASDFRKGIADGMPVASAAVQALTGVIKRSSASTFMGLEITLRAAADELRKAAAEARAANASAGEGSGVASLTGASRRTPISLDAACELFLIFVTRTQLEQPNFEQTKQLLISRGERFVGMSLRSRQVIAEHGHPFLRDGNTVLIHGLSRVALEVIKRAAAAGRNFSVVTTEGGPDGAGQKVADALLPLGIPVTMILDSAVGYVMERVDLVLVGAEGVVENGGVVNKVGTFQLAIVAKEFGKPFYVAAESFKFARLFPLSQGDIPENKVESGDWRGSPPASSSSSSAKGGGREGGVVAAAATTAAAAAAAAGAAAAAEEEEKKATPASSPFVPRSPAREGVARARSSPRGGPAIAWARGDPKLELAFDHVLCDYTPPKYITLMFTDLGVLTPSAVSDELIKIYS